MPETKSKQKKRKRAQLPSPLHPVPSHLTAPGSGAPLRAQAGARSDLGTSMRSRHTQSPKQSATAPISGKAGEVCGCWIRKRGGASHCGVGTKGFQRCSCAPLPQPLHNAPVGSPTNPGLLGAVPGANTPLQRGPQLQTPPAVRWAARTSHSRGHPHAAPFPQCNSPGSLGPSALWRTPKWGPVASPPLLRGRPLRRSHFHPQGLRVSSPTAAGFWARCRVPRRAWGRCPGCAPPLLPVPPSVRPAHSRPATPPSPLPRCSVSASRGRCIL